MQDREKRKAPGKMKFPGKFPKEQGVEAAFILVFMPCF